MGHSGAIRFQRGVTAAVVLLAHVLLVWIVIEARIQLSERDIQNEPVLATIIEQPRDVRPGAVPIEVKPETIQRVQSLPLPKIPEIAEVTEPAPPDVASTAAPVNVPAPAQPTENTSAPGADRATSGPRGGGRQLVLAQRVVPKYPPQSVRGGEQGNAGVQLRVDERGRVVEARLARSSGFPRLDRAALDAVRKWKFAPAERGSAPNGTWGETEVQFVLYRFTYSRLGSRAVDGVYAEQVKTGTVDEATPGSEVALRRFIADVLSGAVTGDPDPEVREQIVSMRKVLAEWGEVKSMQFTGGVAGRAWVAYDIKPAFRSDQPAATVEVRWDMYEVRHQRATSEWLIAVDRNGMVWNAQAGPAPGQ
jgi:protein TonB